AVIGLLVVLTSISAAGAQQVSSAQAGDWQGAVRDQVKAGKLDAALQITDERLASAPADLEAHGWRGRLLAWKGRWSDAEYEYRLILRSAPNDVDILIGLADVLLWQKKPDAALEIIDGARWGAPANEDVLLRHA